MAKYIPVVAALALLLTPTVTMAQDADTGKMKGPPNADGYKHNDGAGAAKSTGDESKENNGAGAATSTGEDKK